MTTFINTEVFRDQTIALLNAEMTKAAEPIIQQALKDIEVEMRRQLAQFLIAKIDRDVSIDRFGSDIRVLIKQAKA